MNDERKGKGPRRHLKRRKSERTKERGKGKTKSERERETKSEYKGGRRKSDKGVCGKVK